MKRKLIHFDPNDAGKLHCDVCTYDMPAKLTWGVHLIGTRCPRCAADMLTRQDYLATQKMFDWLNWLNKWFGWLGGKPDDPRLQSLSVKLHNNTVEMRRDTHV